MVLPGCLGSSVDESSRGSGDEAIQIVASIEVDAAPPPGGPKKALHLERADR